MLPVTLDLATRADLPRIVEISNLAALHTSANFATEPEPLEEWIQKWEQHSRFHPWLVWRSGGSVVGFAKTSPHHTRGAYHWTADAGIYLDPRFHGRGIGTALYDALISLVRTQGYVTLIAGISEGNAASERLHTKAGFIRCGTYHRVGWKFGRWHDVSYWELPLRAGVEPGEIRSVAEAWLARAKSFSPNHKL